MAILLISKLKQANNGKFALVDADDVEMPDGTRLSDKELLTAEEVKGIVNGLHEPVTQAEYDALVQAGTVDPNKYYYIKKEE